MALPAQITFGTVTGKLLSAVADTADAGTSPDGVALQGQVTFSPQIGKTLYNGSLAGGGRLLVASATPPATVVAKPVPVVLDVNGAFTVDLIATDNPDIAPTGWTWEVSFALTGVTIPKFSFAMPAGTSVDLAVVAPIEVSTGSALFVNEAAASAASAAASAASAALSASLVGAPADSAVAAIVGNPASVTRTALSSTYLTQAAGVAKGSLLFNAKDYGAIGNGVADDTAAITAAFAAATAVAGGTVYLPPGTYLTGQLTLPTKVSMLGAGTQASILKLKAASGVGRQILAASDCRIERLTVDGNKAAQTTGNCYGINAASPTRLVIADVLVKNPLGDGVILTGTPVDCRIERVTVDGAGGNSGIRADGSTLVDQCSVLNTVKANFQLYGTGNTVRSSRAVAMATTMSACEVVASGNAVTGCVFDMTASTVALGCCVSTRFDSNDNRIENNTLLGGNMATGIAVGALGWVVGTSNLSASRNVIRGNTIKNTASDAIMVGNVYTAGNVMSGRDNLIEGNLISHTQRNVALPGDFAVGIEVTVPGTIIRGNTVNDAGGTGIYIAGLAPDCVVSGNKVTGCGRVSVSGGNPGGIHIHGAGAVVSGNVCVDNGVAADAGLNCAGISVLAYGATEATYDVIVTGNRCYDTRTSPAHGQDFGIFVYSNASGSVKRALITGNNTTGNGLGGIWPDQIAGDAATDSISNNLGA